MARRPSKKFKIGDRVLQKEPCQIRCEGYREELSGLVGTVVCFDTWDNSYDIGVDFGEEVGEWTHDLSGAIDTQTGRWYYPKELVKEPVMKLKTLKVYKDVWE
jgi:hypothetical protein